MARQREALETTALLKKVHLSDVDKIGSDISSSEDELLTGESLEINYSPIDRNSTKFDKNECEDAMSLSSLSDNEQKIEEAKIETNVLPPPPPPDSTSGYPYQQYSGISFKL